MVEIFLYYRVVHRDGSYERFLWPVVRVAELNSGGCEYFLVGFSVRFVG